MKTLSIDLETYSALDLAKVGLYRYSAACTILLFGYAYDDDKPTVIDVANGEQLPKQVRADLENPLVLKVAFNAYFEMNVLQRCWGIKIDPRQWSCTMVLCYRMGLPGSLKMAGKALFDMHLLIEDGQKDATGQKLIRLFCRAQSVHRPKLDGFFTLFHDDPLPDYLINIRQSPSLWQRFKEYNAQDVEAERAIRNAIKPFLPALPKTEQDIWALDWDINGRGVKIDSTLVDSALRLAERVRQITEQDASRLMGGGNVNSIQNLRAWLIQMGAIEEAMATKFTATGEISLDKEARQDIMTRLQEDPAMQNVVQVLECKDTLAKSSIKKYTAMKSAKMNDGRVHGMLQFYGAARTGRWAGRLVQLHNLPQNHLNTYPDELDAARQAVRSYALETLDFVYDSTKQQSNVLSQLIRTAFIPRTGYKFVVADFSAIEARVLAWLAGETWVLDAFKAHHDIYCETASQMFGVPVEKLGVNGHLRQKGKVAVLGCGYGGGINALKAFGADKMGLSDDDLKTIVANWRKANPRITAFWSATEECVINMLRGADTEIPIQIGAYKTPIIVMKQGDFLQVRLPSGRSLVYAKPRYQELKREQTTYVWETNDRGGKSRVLKTVTVPYYSPYYYGLTVQGAWGVIHTWGGKLVENITQAVARDCLAEAMLNLAQAGYKPVMHVHDEVICEMPIGQGSVDEMCTIMCRPPDWAKDLPLAADGFESMYYKKD